MLVKLENVRQDGVIPLDYSKQQPVSVHVELDILNKLEAYGYEKDPLLQLWIIAAGVDDVY